MGNSALKDDPTSRLKSVAYERPLKRVTLDKRGTRAAGE